MSRFPAIIQVRDSSREKRLFVRNAIRLDEQSKNERAELELRLKNEATERNAEILKNNQIAEKQRMASAVSFVTSLNSNVGVATKNFHGFKEASKLYNFPCQTIKDNYIKSLRAPIETTVLEEFDDIDKLFMHSIDECVLKNGKPFSYWNVNKEKFESKSYGAKKFAKAVNRRKLSPPVPYFAKMGRGDFIMPELLDKIKDSNYKDMSGKLTFY